MSEPLPNPWTDDPYLDPAVTHDGIELIAAFRRGAGKCGICGEPVDLTIDLGRLKPSLDHILPRAHGGGDERANLQLAHVGCNSRKRHRITDEQAARIDRERQGGVVVEVSLTDDGVRVTNVNNKEGVGAVRFFRATSEDG